MVGTLCCEVKYHSVREGWMECQNSQAFPLTWFCLPLGAWTIPKMAPVLQKDTSPILHTFEHEFKGLHIAQLHFWTVKNHLLDLVVSYLVMYHVQWTHTQEFPCITINTFNAKSSCGRISWDVMNMVNACRRSRNEHKDKLKAAN